MQPLVSIIIPVYNGTDYMREAIDSALAQTYPNIEVIVVNDGSTDEGKTEETALSYGDRIRYFKKENGGVSSALNFGIRRMQGEYFSWLSHDDVYTPEKVRCQMELLLPYRNEKVVALCGERQIDENSAFLPYNRKQRMVAAGRNAWSLALMDLLQNGAFCGCSFLLPRSVFQEVGFFDEKLRYSQDMLMWMKIFSNQYDLVYEKSADVYSRVHSRQLTQNGRALFVKDSLAIAEMMSPKLAELSQKETDFLYAFAVSNAVYNIKEAVLRCVEESASFLKFSPLMVLKLRVILLYGKIRPVIRKLYYRFIQRVSV